MVSVTGGVRIANSRKEGKKGKKAIMKHRV
jgi:hypothetical protein